jgi:hypothetical protein
MLRLQILSAMMDIAVHMVVTAAVAITGEVQVGTDHDHR